jgi:hypothetical protein
MFAHVPPHGITMNRKLGRVGVKGHATATHQFYALPVWMPADLTYAFPYSLYHVGITL